MIILLDQGQARVTYLPSEKIVPLDIGLKLKLSKIQKSSKDKFALILILISI